MAPREYVCPDRIVEIYDEDPEYGFELTKIWISTLPLEVWDRIWTPDVGWIEKNGPRIQ